MTSMISVNCVVAGGNNMWIPPGDSPSKVCNSTCLQNSFSQIFLAFLQGSKSESF